MMFGVHCSLLPVLVLLAASLPAGALSQEDNLFEDNTDVGPIHCYQCNSGVDVDCPNLEVNSTHSIHYKPCDAFNEYKGAKPFCRKIIQTIYEREHMVRVIRKCGWEKHPRLDCYHMSNDDHVETVCQCFTDGCNSAGRSALTSLLLGIWALLYVLVS